MFELNSPKTESLASERQNGSYRGVKVRKMKRGPLRRFPARAEICRREESSGWLSQFNRLGVRFRRWLWWLFWPRFSLFGPASLPLCQHLRLMMSL